MPAVEIKLEFPLKKLRSLLANPSESIDSIDEVLKKLLVQLKDIITTNYDPTQQKKSTFSFLLKTSYV